MDTLKKLINKCRPKSEYLILLLIFCVFLFLKLLIYSKGLVFFDEGIYIGISKYFSSVGNIGYFESIRPLGLPLILIPFMWIKLNSLITGRIISLILLFVSIIIVYIVTKKHFGKKAAFWASYLFATNTLIVLFGGLILTDIIAYTLALLSTSFILENKYILSGVFIGVTFLIRFPGAIIALPLILYIVIREKTKISPVTKFCLGLILTIIPYFIFNFFYYNGPLIDRLFTPLIDATRIVQYDTWFYPKSNLLRFISDIFITNPLAIILSAIAIFFYFKTHKEKITILLACILVILFYFSYKVKIYDIRYTLFTLPFISVIAGAGISKLLTKMPKYFINILIFLILVPGLVTSAIYLQNPIMKNDKNIEKIISEVKGNKIITNHAFTLLYSNVKTDLYPGPNIDNTYTNYYQDKDAKLFVFKPDEYYCPPHDKFCSSEFIKKINFMLSKNNILYCGFMHGEKFIIFTKDQNNFITKSECLRNINYEEIETPKTNIIIRINAIRINKIGDLGNNKNLNKLIRLLEDKKINSTLIIVPNKNNPNKDTLSTIKSLNSTNIGIFYSDKDLTNNFEYELKTSYKINFTVVSPIDDEWTKKEVLIPNGIKYCMRGPWDLTIVNIPCYSVNIYSTKDWKNFQLYELGELKTNFETIKNFDPNIVVDIDSNSLSKNENFQIIENFIDYIS